ncbi:unnamed protein product [Meloidogyne enterolobii]|uniref:Uncharacterized protein n=1 Tax=Meloidogyne enterolobii TaxID=390850 RepID=A0ACB0XZQ4_MELEN
MKLDRILIILIFNAIFWSLINSVKNNKEINELTRGGETSKDNDGAESSVNAKIQKFERMLNPTPKITEKGTTVGNNETKKFNRKEYMKIYRQNNKAKRRESDQEYRKNNREKIQEYFQKYCQDNKEKLQEKSRKYRQNNKEKKREWNRKYRESKKNKKANLRNIYSDNGETSVNTKNDHFGNKGKLPIVYEEGIRFEEGNGFNQEEEEGNIDEAETYVDEQNQTMVEEPNRIPKNYMNQMNLNEYPFDLNEKPEDEDGDR